ncbi:hypothetical protein B6259_04165 [Ruminococcaceae bacterium CPB6]|nr:hypothetical protein B6259_04165 [Ruminococcaceae bacterium CPB6]QKO30797.1 DUF4358 domain-containing protein [Caproicibacterium lactatifermentans]
MQPLSVKRTLTCLNRTAFTIKKHFTPSGPTPFYLRFIIMKKTERFLIPAAMAVCVAVLLLFIGFLQKSGKISKADIKTVSHAVTSVTDMSQMEEGDNSMVKRLYGLEPGKYNGTVLYYPTSAATANEILIVKLTDIKQQDEVKAAVEARLAVQKKNFNGYGVGQYEMLQNSVTDISGNYVLFAATKNAKAADAAFQKTL